MGENNRKILVIVHKLRESAKAVASGVKQELEKYDIDTVTVEDLPALDANGTNNIELILVLGGDGSMLSSAVYARKYDIPMMGVNLGHVGFLAEVETQDISQIAKKIAEKDYRIENHTTLKIHVERPDGTTETDWALNEAVVLRTDLVHPAYLTVGIDGEPISSFGCDGVILATPTGSTAYAFSVGAPVVWPDVDALIVAPLAAHALFTRTMIVGRNSKLKVSVLAHQWADVKVCCDSLREITAPEGSQITAYADDKVIKLARMDDVSFSSRLVSKFNLPVHGWRKQIADEDKRNHYRNEYEYTKSNLEKMDTKKLSE